MWLHTWKQWKNNASLSLYIKCGAVLLLFITSIVIVSCSTTDNTQNDTGTPGATITIQIGDNNGSPIPTAPEWSCGAWVTNTTVGYKTTTTINIFAKFVHNVDGNPEGVGGALGVATILWPAPTGEQVVNATTTADGLAIFPVVLQDSALDKVVLVTVTFTKDGVPPCTVDGDKAAFFSVVMVSPTPSATAKASPSVSPTGTPSATPTDSPTPNVTPTVTPSAGPGSTPTPTPTPKK